MVRQQTLYTSIVLALSLHSSAIAAPVEKMVPTLYDDGIACPGGCDAHVVFSEKHNGTANAFLPGTSRTNPGNCTVGDNCVICFDESDDSCMEATYRGGGPPAGRFDFTPAFFTKTCPLPRLPEVLKVMCQRMESDKKKYESERVSCFEHVDHKNCVDVIKAAKKAREADTPERAACLAEGQAAYNRRQPDEKKRINACNYEFLRRGSNSRGDKWHMLLPAACREGTFVGSFGTDCCYGDWYSAAHLHPECAVFFPLRSKD
jgi:hypothetical protein